MMCSTVITNTSDRSADVDIAYRYRSGDVPVCPKSRNDSVGRGGDRRQCPGISRRRAARDALLFFRLRTEQRPKRKANPSADAKPTHLSDPCTERAPPYVDDGSPDNPSSTYRSESTNRLSKIDGAVASRISYFEEMAPLSLGPSTPRRKKRDDSEGARENCQTFS
eukprot:Selendium_serpulae@DN6210_c1_g1_i5.p1